MRLTCTIPCKILLGQLARRCAAILVALSFLRISDPGEHRNGRLVSAALAILFSRYCAPRPPTGDCPARPHRLPGRLFFPLPTGAPAQCRSAGIAGLWPVRLLRRPKLACWSVLRRWWLPWLLAAYQRATGPRTIRDTALGALAGGMMILAGYFQTALYGFLAPGLFALSGLWSNRRRGLRSVPIVIGIAAGAAAVAAIQVLPGLELTAHSIRAAADYSSSTEGTLHLRPLLTLFAPDSLGAISGNYTGPFDVTQYYLYAGRLLVPLAALGAAKTRMRWPALTILIPTLWYLAGPAGGFYRLAGIIPGLHKVRAPIQGWFIAALALAMLAGAGADWIFGRWRVPALPFILIAFLFADVWYWNSFNNPLAYARGSFAELYGDREAYARQQVAETQAPLTRFDGPRAFPGLGPLDHPLDLRLETTYGYFALEPAL